LNKENASEVEKEEEEKKKEKTVKNVLLLFC
jgi:hypothetical protein